LSVKRRGTRCPARNNNGELQPKKKRKGTFLPDGARSAGVKRDNVDANWGDRAPSENKWVQALHPAAGLFQGASQGLPNERREFF